MTYSKGMIIPSLSLEWASNSIKNLANTHIKENPILHLDLKF